MERDTFNYNGHEYVTACVMGMVFAEEALSTALLAEGCNFQDDIAEMVDSTICRYTNLVLEDLSEADFINGLLKEYPEYFSDKFDSDTVRRCEVCGKVMDKGYYFEGDGYYACSDECLLKFYDGDRAEMEADRDKFGTDGEVFFYTEWESPFYD